MIRYLVRMCLSRVPDDESLFRSVVYPFAFKKTAFRPEKFLRLTVQNSKIEASLARQMFAPIEEEIHKYGCRLAHRNNDLERLRGQYKDQDRRIYCGCYQVKTKSIRNLAATVGLEEVLSANVEHIVEHGEIAHVNLVVCLKTEIKFNVEATKTAIIDRLWNASTGPIQHVCPCDLGVLAHPSLSLEAPPLGPFVDTRSRFRVKWEVIRWRLLVWFQAIFEPAGGSDSGQ
jgi:hypothetical protein